MRPRASSTSSLGRFIEGGSRPSVAASSVCSAMSRELAAAERSISAPDFVECVDRSPHHAREVLDGVELAQARVSQSCSNRLLQLLGIDRLQEPAGEAAGELSHGHDLHAISAAPGSVGTDHVTGQFGVDDDGAAAHCHDRPSERIHDRGAGYSQPIEHANCAC